MAHINAIAARHSSVAVTSETQMTTKPSDEDSAAFQKEEELRDEMRAEEAEYRQQVRDYRDAHVGRY